MYNNIINEDISHINHIIKITRNNILDNEIYNDNQILKNINIIKNKSKKKYHINKKYKVKYSYMFYPFYGYSNY